MSSHLSLQRDQIDERLKADARQQRAQHIDDDGFTLRVMDVLPQKRHVSAAFKFAIPFAFTLFACIIAVAFTSVGSFVFDAYMDLMTETVTPTLVGVAVAIIAFYVVSIGSALSEAR